MTGCLAIMLLSFAAVDAPIALDLEAGDAIVTRGAFIPAPQGRSPNACFILDDDPFDDDDNDGEKKATARLVYREAHLSFAVADLDRFHLLEPFLERACSQAARLHLRI